MAKIYDFPEKEEIKKHHWYHFAYTAVHMRFNNYDCLFCDRCKNWRIRKRVANKFLYTEKWVSYEEFRSIINEDELAELKPRHVWILNKLEKFFREKINEYSTKAPEVDSRHDGSD